jgi:hypothetical protein
MSSPGKRREMDVMKLCVTHPLTPSHALAAAPGSTLVHQARALSVQRTEARGGQVRALWSVQGSRRAARRCLGLGDAADAERGVVASGVVAG